MSVVCLKDGSAGNVLLNYLWQARRVRTLRRSLHCGMMDVQDIFFTLDDTVDVTDFTKAMEKLNSYFAPKANVPFERHEFRQMKQDS
jgi:hypothetical protein